ncbi:MAG: ribbon-helix-helix protein [Candidatus Limnocylindrales bacterium]
MTAVTTIKVPKELRDRIARQAADRGVTAAQLLDELLQERERRARLDAVRAAYADRDAAYTAEVDVWDTTLADGRT